MISYKDYPHPPEFKSDGCTVLFFLKPLFKKYKEACRWHDWARRHSVHYGVISVEDADGQLYQYWRDLGMWAWFARISWNVVKVTRGKYSTTHPVPDKSWLEYVYPRGV